MDRYAEHVCIQDEHDGESTETDDEKGTETDTDTGTETDDDDLLTHSFICKIEHWSSVVAYGLYYLTPRRYEMFRRTPHRNPRRLPRTGDHVRFIGGSYQNRRLLGIARVAVFQHNGYAGHIHLSDVTDHLLH
jgi:hypothetical protein